MVKNEIIYDSKNLYLTIEGRELKISFFYLIFFPRITTIKVKENNKWVKVGEVRKKHNGFLTFGNNYTYLVKYENELYSIRKTRGQYKLENGLNLILKLYKNKNLGRDLDIYLNNNKIGRIIYPKTHFVKSSITIQIDLIESNELLKPIKLMVLAVSTNRWINGFTDSSSPISNESQW